MKNDRTDSGQAYWSRSRHIYWRRWYAIRSYVTSALWIAPFIALVIEIIFAHLCHHFGAWLIDSGAIDAKTGLFAMSLSGARSLLETIVTASLSFLVFTFGSLLVAIQVAGGQYTPRVIATTLLRNNVVRCCVGLFIFTLLFAMRTLREMDDSVSQFNAMFAGILGLSMVVAFLFLIDYAARMLRPVSIVIRVGTLGLDVVTKMYPATTSNPRKVESVPRLDPNGRVFLNSGPSGVVLAVDLSHLVALARTADGVIEFIPQIGDFIARGEPLFRLHGGAGNVDDRDLLGAVALGSERTIDQDPTFALRILVDIAIKALSPAINDPTTAVLAIDQLHRLLWRIGQRDLRGEVIADNFGESRLIFRTPNWEDFVHLACTEIRHCGVGSIQIVRRMRAMLENLILALPEHRHAELSLQLDLLDRAIDAQYKFPEDLALARIPDSQGLGGALGIKPANSQ